VTITESELRQLLESINVQWDTPSMMSRDSYIRFLDLRWKFNGLDQLYKLYLAKRREAMYDIIKFKQVIEIFDSAMEDRLSLNLVRLCELAGFRLETVEGWHQHYFDHMSESDMNWLLNVD
jgi:hypothetical protein